MSANIIYEYLTDSVAVGGIIDSVKTNNFWVKEFLTDNAVINGNASEYYSSNPSSGLDYANRTKKGTKKAKHDDDKVYKCRVPVLFNRTFRANINPDMLRIATGSPEKAEMIAALQANNLKKQLDIEIAEACVKIVVKKENYAEKSWVEVEEKELLKEVFAISELMKHPSTDYNKGFLPEGKNDWEKALFTGESLADFIIILNSTKKTDIRFEGAKTYNYNLIDLEQEFKAVYDYPFADLAGGKKIGALIMHKDSFALNWEISPNITIKDHPEDELTKRASLVGFVIGGMVSFANSAAIIIKPTPAPVSGGSTQEVNNK